MQMNADMIVAATNILMAIATFYAARVALLNTEDYRFKKYASKQNCDLVLVVRERYLRSSAKQISAEVIQSEMYKDVWGELGDPEENIFESKRVVYLTLNNPAMIKQAIVQLRISCWFSSAIITKKGEDRCLKI